MPLTHMLAVNSSPGHVGVWGGTTSSHWVGGSYTQLNSMCIKFMNRVILNMERLGWVVWLSWPYWVRYWAPYVWYYVAFRIMYVIQDYVIRDYVFRDYIVWDYVAFRIMSFKIISFGIMSFEIMSFKIMSFGVMPFGIILFGIVSHSHLHRSA